MPRYLIAIVCLSLSASLYSDVGIKRLDPSDVVLKSDVGDIKVSDLEGIDSVLDRFEDNIRDLYEKTAQQKLLEKILILESKKGNYPNVDAYLRNLDQKVRVTDKELAEYQSKNASILKVYDPVLKINRDMTQEEIKSNLKVEKSALARRQHFEKLLDKVNIKQNIVRTPIDVPVAKHNPIKGKSNAKITLHAFSDFQCTFCAKSAQELKLLTEKHKNKLKVVFHHLPLSNHTFAKPAAIASVCAQEQGKFWEFHDAIFKLRNLDSTSIDVVAKQISLNQELFESCRKNPEVAQLIDDDLNKAKKLGIQSTPSFILGHRKIAGYKNLSELEALSNIK